MSRTRVEPRTFDHRKSEHLERKQYICPICKSDVDGPDKVWAHTKEEHKDVYGKWASTEDEENEKTKFVEGSLVPPKDSQFVSTPQNEKVARTASQSPDAARNQSSQEVDADVVECESPEFGIDGFTSNPVKRERESDDGFENPAPRLTRPAESPPAHISERVDSDLLHKAIDESKRSPEGKKSFDPHNDNPNKYPVPTRGNNQAQPSFGTLHHHVSKNRTQSDVGDRLLRRQPSNRSHLVSKVLQPESPQKLRYLKSPDIQFSPFHFIEPKTTLSPSHKAKTDPSVHIQKIRKSDSVHPKESIMEASFHSKESGIDATVPSRTPQRPASVHTQDIPTDAPDHSEVSQIAARTPSPEVEVDDILPEINILVPEVKARDITADDLDLEATSIYGGMRAVEKKCRDVDADLLQKTYRGVGGLTRPQWRVLLELHRQLLREHHDLLLSSQHPNSRPYLKRMPLDQNLASRMWKHGIIGFLNLLRHHLPFAYEIMVSYIHIAYEMLSLFCEVAPAFLQTWIESLGDLARWRMSIPDEDRDARDFWINIAKSWYSKAIRTQPENGRLYHHIAILTRKFSLEQLSRYSICFTCQDAFVSARQTIPFLFNPYLALETDQTWSMPHLIIRAHATLYYNPNGPLEELDQAIAPLQHGHGAEFRRTIIQLRDRFKGLGVHLAVANIGALFDFGNQESFLRLAFDNRHDTPVGRQSNKSMKRPKSSPKHATKHKKVKKSHHAGEPSNVSSSKTTDPPTDQSANPIPQSTIATSYASAITFLAFKVALEKSEQPINVTLPFVHVMFIFIWSISAVPDAIDPFEKDIPWAEMCLYLNELPKDEEWKDSIWTHNVFPSPALTCERPPPEHYYLQGQVYTQDLFPEGWFDIIDVSDEERMVEVPSHNSYRMWIIHWLAARISTQRLWIRYDKSSEKFIDMTSPKRDIAAIPQTSKSSTVNSPTDKGKGKARESTSPPVDADVEIDEDAMPDVIVERSKQMGFDDFTDAGPLTKLSLESRTNTDSSDHSKDTVMSNNTENSDHLDLKIVTNFHQTSQGGPEPVEMSVNEPQDTPMMDISPIEEHPPPLVEIEEAPWVPDVMTRPEESNLPRGQARNDPEHTADRTVQD